ncbi:unnamed protein product [Lasius platythorax]|uniref:Uncharacterized protein n=1 Tax=Lasius platythorax TaxID=488582 RepID=A0AAV2NX90_9HYME
MWGDTADAREWESNNSWMFENIFDLRILFGLESYDTDYRGRGKFPRISPWTSRNSSHHKVMRKRDRRRPPRVMTESRY